MNREDPMSSFPADLFAGKRFYVVGLGKNGLPAARALAAMGATVEAWDDNAAARAAADGVMLRDPCADAASGEFSYDALVLSPGIPHLRPQPHSAAERARAAGVPILSDVELLFQAVRKSGSRARFAGKLCARKTSAFRGSALSMPRVRCWPRCGKPGAKRSANSFCAIKGRAGTCIVTAQRPESPSACTL